MKSEVTLQMINEQIAALSAEIGKAMRLLRQAKTTPEQRIAIAKKANAASVAVRRANAEKRKGV